MWRVYIILYISCLSSPFSLFWPATLILFLAVRTHWTTVLVNIFIKYLPQESWWRYSITKCCQQVLWNSLLLWIIVKMTVALFTNLLWVCQRIVTLSVNAIIIQNLFSVVFTVFSSFTSVIVFFFFSPFYHILDRVYLHLSDGFPKYEHPLLYFIHFTSVKCCQ